MKRGFTLTPDEHKRGKVRVYPYEWEEEGDRLRMVYDRQSWGLVEMETNEFLVGCYLEDEKLVAGLPAAASLGDRQPYGKAPGGRPARLRRRRDRARSPGVPAG